MPSETLYASPENMDKMWESPENEIPDYCLEKYRNQLNDLRREFSVRDLPDVPFFQFGMGNRKKLIYKNGKLYDPFTGNLYQAWEVKSETLIPNEYRVDILTSTGNQVVIFENETGVYIREDIKTRQVENTAVPLNLPDF